MLNIVLPIAGRGSRFAAVGVGLPKPLIPVHGVPMIAAVAHNVRPSVPHRFVFVVLRAHLDRLELGAVLERAAPGCIIVPVEQVTEGAACTVLLARDLIDTDDPLMLANSDQWVDCDIDAYLSSMDARSADGLIMTMTAHDPKWSFVKCDSRGRVTVVVEKKVVSDQATVGIYNFRRGRDFVWAADAMIAKDIRVNNEFYVAPVFNELIARGSIVTTFNVGEDGCGMYGLGTPEDLETFLRDPASPERIARCGRAFTEPCAPLTLVG